MIRAALRDIPSGVQVRIVPSIVVQKLMAKRATRTKPYVHDQ
jgi:hypothetical protein